MRAKYLNCYNLKFFTHKSWFSKFLKKMLGTEYITFLITKQKTRLKNFGNIGPWMGNISASAEKRHIGWSLVLQFTYFFKLEKLGFCFFVGDIIMGVGSRILAEVIGPWASNQWPNFLTQSFIGNKAIIHVMRAVDQLFTISGSEIMTQKTKFW